VRLLAAPGTAGALRLGLHFELQPGWKIYWRAPGDAGLPPETDWTGSTNLTIGETSWPVPDRFSYAGLETFGYEDEMVLPLAATLPDPSAPVRAQASVHFLTCAAICVPNDVDLVLDIPAGAAASPESAALIDRFARRVPGPAADAGLTLIGATIAESGKDAVLSVRLHATPTLQRPDLLVEGADGFSYLPPVQSDEDGVTVLKTTLPGGAAATAKLPGRQLGLTVIDRAAPPEAIRAGFVSAAPLVAAPITAGVA
jgi:suppressor for copper-sensitivity B